MKILVTNDDGIFSEGINLLASALSELGEVWVVAPDRERNAISHAITLHRPLRVTQLSSRRYAVNGTPSDCVNLGVHLILKEKPDLVASGINRGANLGDDINYSGTVAAAVEGTLMDIPSFAISLAFLTTVNFTPAAHFALNLARAILRKGLPARTLLNVNVPDTEGKEITTYRITSQGKNTFANSIEEKVDPRGDYYYWIGRREEPIVGGENTDLHAIKQKLISITPLKVDRTHYDSLPELLRWDI